ncbi:MAG: YybH family protein [Gemmatimonadaceae bacterium]
MHSVHCFGCAVVLATFAACQRTVETGVDLRTAESEIRARSQAVVAAEIRKDLEAVMPFYADSAVLHMEGMPAVQGHPGIREAYKAFFSAPMTFDRAVITDVDVARSGDLAYETGTNHFTMTAGDQRVPATGKYLIVWRRSPGGAWVVAALAVTNDRAMAQ